LSIGNLQLLTHDNLPETLAVALDDGTQLITRNLDRSTRGLLLLDKTRQD